MLTWMAGCLFRLSQEPTREENGHALVQDVRKPELKSSLMMIKMKLRGSTKGYAKPFLKWPQRLSATQKVSKVELEEDMGFGYELKLNHENNIIK